jgi:hypothetical protein
MGGGESPKVAERPTVRDGGDGGMGRMCGE